MRANAFNEVNDAATGVASTIRSLPGWLPPGFRSQINGAHGPRTSSTAGRSQPMILRRILRPSRPEPANRRSTRTNDGDLFKRHFLE